VAEVALLRSAYAHARLRPGPDAEMGVAHDPPMSAEPSEYSCGGTLRRDGN